MTVVLMTEPHPWLDAGTFVTTFASPLSEQPSPPWLTDLLRLDAPVPFHADDAVRTAIRTLLRHGGFKPSGRSKPASEYLQRAAGEGGLESINAAVDACNVVSLHSGVPISVVDVDRAMAPFTVRIAPAGETYVFNQAGQTIDLEGLLCLYDTEGPCANAVKDSHRTKTNAATVCTLSVLWSSHALDQYASRVVAWYRELLERLGGHTTGVPFQQ